MPVFAAAQPSIYLLFTTLAESTRNRGAQETVRAETTDVGHDIQYTELYNLMSHVLSTIFLFLCLIFHNGEGDDINVVAIGAIIIFAVIVILLESEIRLSSRALLIGCK